MSIAPSLASAEIPYDRLSPDLMMAALERIGLEPDGRMLALNSYENRVYQMGLEDQAPVVVKFYRPGRWSTAAIEEEHAFAAELVEADIPVVAPLRLAGATLHCHEGYPYAVYPRRGGRWPDLDTTEDRERIGRFLGRIHRVGAAHRFVYRARFDPVRQIEAAIDTIEEGGWLPDYQVDPYAEVARAIADRVADAFEAVMPRTLRIHGDCHRGNVLWTDAGAHFVDLDDCTTGPAVQDLWMLAAGTPDERRRQWTDVLEGYEQFASFDRSELTLVEPLRAFRMLHYAAWLARRWQDPAFPKAFPWFGGPRYWEDHVRELSDQLQVMEEPTLRL
jgi:Ser/Thr protein kinase RdoA (MazF antagonist)